MEQGFLWGVIVVLAVTVACVAVGLVQCWIELKAMKNSTHQITYIDPLQQQFGKKPDDETVTKMNEDPLGNIGLGDYNDEDLEV